MQEHTQLTQKQINDDLLKDILHLPKLWIPAVLFLGTIIVIGLSAFFFMVYHGVGVTGLNRPVFWGFFIANFVFWIGISHAGIMISAILRLTQAEWRRPITRAAEVIGVVSKVVDYRTFDITFMGEVIGTKNEWNSSLVESMSLLLRT